MCPELCDEWVGSAAEIRAGEGIDASCCAGVKRELHVGIAVARTGVDDG
jgi:hypothetical protein